MGMVWNLHCLRHHLKNPIVKVGHMCSDIAATNTPKENGSAELKLDSSIEGLAVAALFTMNLLTISVNSRS